MTTTIGDARVATVDTGVDTKPVGRSLAPAAYILSSCLAVVAAGGALLTFAFGGLLRGPAVMNGSVRGTALVMLTIGVPLLAGAMILAARGSVRATFVWLGAVMYLTYNASLILVGTPMNRLFLLYEASLALALASGIAVAVGMRVAALHTRCEPTLPARVLGGFLTVVAVLNALAWLGDVVPAVLDDTVPRLLEGEGVSIVPTYFQDLAIWLPLLAVAGVWLWQRRPWGYLLGGGGLVYLTIELVTIAADQWFGHRADPTSSIASDAAVIPFTVAALIGLAAIVAFLRHVKDR